MALAARVELGDRQVVEHTFDTSYPLGNHADSIPLTPRVNHPRKMDQTVGDRKR